jgi:hypothetical protein
MEETGNEGAAALAASGRALKSWAGPGGPARKLIKKKADG